MDSTVVTMIGVGVSLAAIVLTGQRSLRTEIAAVETRLGKRIDDVETRLGKRIADTKSELRGEISAVETRLGKRMDRLEERVNGLSDRLSNLQGALSAVFAPLRRGALPESTPDESPV